MSCRLRLAALVTTFMVAACGSTTPTGSVSSPTAHSPSGSPSAAASASASPRPGATPSAAPSPPAATRLVIQDYQKNQVRLARFDAVDVAAVTGSFDGVVAGHAIVINGLSLLAVTASGAVTTLGHLAGSPELSGPGSVAVSPDLSQWVYTIPDFTNLTSHVHLGGAAGDRSLADIPSPDGNTFYQPFVWNATGVYVVREGTGLGGAGPFIEYHFPVGKLDIGTGTVTMVSPACVVEQVLDDGTLLCRTATGGLEVRPPSGQPHDIQVATSTAPGANSVYSRLTVSADQQRFVAARNGNANANLINYQMVVGAVSGQSVAVFGPPDFFPDAWLPDGRIVADHLCYTFQGNGGPCDQTLDGTYFISADGSARTLFFKVSQSASVVGYL